MPNCPKMVIYFVSSLFCILTYAIYLFNICHCGGCEIESRCSFKLHFHKHYWYWEYCLVVIGHLGFLFCELPYNICILYLFFWFVVLILALVVAVTLKPNSPRLASFSGPGIAHKFFWHQDDIFLFSYLAAATKVVRTTSKLPRPQKHHGFPTSFPDPLCSEGFLLGQR